jgi:hypothetical protein
MLFCHCTSSIDSPHNTTVRAFLVQEITKEDNGYEKPVIMSKFHFDFLRKNNKPRQCA